MPAGTAVVIRPMPAFDGSRDMFVGNVREGSDLGHLYRHPGEEVVDRGGTMLVYDRCVSTAKIILHTSE